MTKKKKEGGEWIEGEDNIAQEAIKKIQIQFTKDSHQRNFSLLKQIPKILNEEDNKRLIAPPNMEELKDIVFSMSSHSAPGPDGMSRKVYHTCWEIINEDLLLMLFDFFAGTPLPRSFTNTCLVMLPKVECPHEFNELRPISLSNFSYKIISNFMNHRLGPLMQKFVSPCQTGFIKGRSITENIILTQEYYSHTRHGPQH